MRDLYDGGIDFAAAHSASLGFSGVEFLDMCGTGAPIDKEKYPTKEVRRALDENGLTVDCYSVYANVFAMEKADFLRSIYREIDYAAAVGSKIFHHTIMPSLSLDEGSPDYEAVFSEVLDITKSVAEYCERLGLECIYEPQGMYFNGVGALSKLLLAMRETLGNVGFCADLGNPVFVDEDPVAVTAALASCARHVHVKDYIVSDKSLGRAGEMRSRGGKYLYEVIPPEGELKIGDALKLLKKSGYSGSISLEFAADDARMKEAVEYLKDLI